MRLWKKYFTAVTLKRVLFLTLNRSRSPSLKSSERIWILKSNSSPRLIKALISCMQPACHKHIRKSHCQLDWQEKTKLLKQNEWHLLRWIYAITKTSQCIWMCTLRAMLWMFMPEIRGWNLSISCLSASSVIASKTRSWLQNTKLVTSDKILHNPLI